MVCIGVVGFAQSSSQIKALDLCRPQPDKQDNPPTGTKKFQYQPLWRLALRLAGGGDGLLGFRVQGLRT